MPRNIYKDYFNYFSNEKYILYNIKMYFLILILLFLTCKYKIYKLKKKLNIKYK